MSKKNIFNTVVGNENFCTAIQKKTDFDKEIYYLKGDFRLISINYLTENNGELTYSISSLILDIGNNQQFILNVNYCNGNNYNIHGYQPNDIIRVDIKWTYQKKLFGGINEKPYILEKKYENLSLKDRENNVFSILLN